MENNKITIYCDGGSRGNPGPSAIGIYIPQLKKEYSKFLGKATNNEAEYSAVIFALKKIKQLNGKEKIKRMEIEVKADSELLIKQLNGEYKIKEKNLILLFIEIWNLKIDFNKIKFTHIPREENKQADLLANKELNSQNSLF